MFKDQLKQLQEERGLNKTKLAEALGVSPGSVTGYLSGKVTPPYKKQQQFALALGLDADYFKPNVAEAIQTDGGYWLKTEILEKNVLDQPHFVRAGNGNPRSRAPEVRNYAAR